MNRLRRIWAAGLAVLLGLSLAGCGELAEPGLIKCSFGVINTEGLRIVATDEWSWIGGGVETDLVCDDRYVMQVEYNFVLPPEQRFQPRPNQALDFSTSQIHYYWDYDEDFRISGCSFRFYDAWGKLIHSVDIEQPAQTPWDIDFCEPPEGGPQAGVLAIDLLQTEGRYLLLDMAGNVLAEKQVALRSPGNSAQGGIWVIAAAGFLAVGYTDIDPNSREREISYMDIYDWQGRPLQLAQDYYSLIPYRLSTEPNLYRAEYNNEKGYSRYDILDGQGQTLVSGLAVLEYHLENVLAATRSGGNMRSGLMDLQGRWLGQLMAMPRGLQLFYYERGVYNTNGRLVAEEGWNPESKGQAWAVIMPYGRVLVEESFAETWNPSREEGPKPERVRQSLYDAAGRLLQQSWQDEDPELFTRLSRPYELLPLGKYERISPLYYYYSWNYEEDYNYYQGLYKTDQGRYLWDVLDRQGRLLIEGLNDVFLVDENYFEVRQGFEQGLMNDKGEWLYKESIFADWED